MWGYLGVGHGWHFQVDLSRLGLWGVRIEDAYVRESTFVVGGEMARAVMLMLLAGCAGGEHGIL
jgi:hypothetical protein